MRVLVTGAAGFIGSHICERLVAEGDEVVGLDDLSEGSERNLAHLPEVDLVVGDLRDEETVGKAVAGCAVVFHEGALRAVQRSIEAPGPTADVNVRGTLSVLLAARDEGARVVYASSSSVYGDQERFPLTEDLMPRPLSPYAASKLAGEIYCQAWWRSFGVPTVSLRYFNVYGPRQSPESRYAAVIPLFIGACLMGERPIVHGDGEQARDFTYVDDVVEANLRAARADQRAFGRALNVGGGAEPTSVNELLGMIAEITGASPDPLREPPRLGDVRRTHADVSLARDLLGYEPRTAMREGLEKTVAWFGTQARGDDGG